MHQQQNQQQAQEQQVKAPKQAKTKQAKGALSPSAAVRLWGGETVTRSMLVAEPKALTILTTELNLKKSSRVVEVKTSRKAEVRQGRIHQLEKPIQLGTSSMMLDEALTAEEARERVTKWLKRAKALDQLAKQGDEDARVKATTLRARAKTLARAYGLKIRGDKVETAQAETETAE